MSDLEQIKSKMMELVNEIWSPFNGQDRAKVFVFSMAYGFAKGMEPVKPPPAGSGSMPASAFDKEMRDYMKFVAIADAKDLEVATDAKEVVRIIIPVYNDWKSLEKLIQEVS